MRAQRNVAARDADPRSGSFGAVAPRLQLWGHLERSSDCSGNTGNPGFCVKSPREMTAADSDVHETPAGLRGPAMGLFSA